MKTERNKNLKNSKVYLIGSGIAGLASAVYLEKDADVPGENIHILEKDSIRRGTGISSYIILHLQDMPRFRKRA